MADTKDWTWVLEQRCPECGFDAADFEAFRAFLVDSGWFRRTLVDGVIARSATFVAVERGVDGAVEHRGDRGCALAVQGLLVDTLKGVVVAPAEAIQRGPNGPYVYVVASDDTVSMRQVTITRQDEKHAVIADGLTAGEKVVTSGFGRLKDGSTVSFGDGNASPNEVDDAVDIATGHLQRCVPHRRQCVLGKERRHAAATAPPARAHPDP